MSIFTESVIHEMTRRCMIYDGTNLAHGFPDLHEGGDTAAGRDAAPVSEVRTRTRMSNKEMER